MKSNSGLTNVSVDNIELEELKSDDKPKGEPLLSGNFDVIKGLKVQLDVRIGDADLTVDELFKLEAGSVVELNQDVTQPVEMFLDGKKVARGELVVVGDNFGVRITDIEK